MATITEEVLTYQRVGEGLRRLTDQVAELVYNYPASKPGFTEDDCAEFLLRFYPRITALIARYRDRGSSFETYLHSSLRWQLRSFAIERSTDRIRLSTATDRNTSQEIVGEPVARDTPEIETDAPPRRQTERHTSRRKRRPGHRPCALGLSPGGSDSLRLSAGEAQRLVCLTLKTGHCFDPHQWRHLEGVFGCGPGWLEARWHELHAMRFTTAERHDAIRVRRDRAWFRLRCIESRIRESVGEQRYELEAQRARWQRRLERSRQELRHAVQRPTNLQIAQALGIPKGTVDSGLFTLRRELADPSFHQRVARLLEEP